MRAYQGTNKLSQALVEIVREILKVTVGKLAFVGQACRFKADFAAQVG
jgi:hypothetical protein